MPDEKISRRARRGGVETENPIWLAPLAGVTTRDVRDFHRRAGAGLVHTEMISATGVLYNNKKTFKMTGDETEPGPIALQLFGPDAEGMSRAAEAVLRVRRFDALEINMACPMPKVTKKCGGASLLMNPREARAMAERLNRFGVPVWAKIRKTDEAVHPIGTLDFCGELLEAGASLVIIHGRTPAQRYEGAADKEIVIEAARKFPGRVAGSGDVYTPDDARFYLDGGCVAALAARGAMRDALLIPDTLRALGYPADARYADPSIKARAEMIIEAAAGAREREGERHALVTVKRLLAGMFRGARGASALRQAVSSCGNLDSLVEILLEFAEG